MGEIRWVINDAQEQVGAPLAAFAIHHGHNIRDGLAELLAIDGGQRLREEDPFTGRLAEIAERHVIVNVSRFEVDLNRPRQKAVYLKPEDCWGLKPWKADIPEQEIERSLGVYDRFYTETYSLLKKMEDVYGRFVVLDLHSYCHRRSGPDGPVDPVENNPDINIGTGTMDRRFWGSLVDRFIADLGSGKVLSRNLDVRENVRFRGGYFPQWVHQTFPRTGCCLAVEVKKIFMDEWSGQLDEAAFSDIRNALESSLGGLIEELNKIK